MHTKYKLKQKIDEVILNKKVGLLVTILAPIMFFGSAFYVSNCLKGCRLNTLVRDITFSTQFIESTADAKGVEETTDSTKLDDGSIFEGELEPIYGDPKKLKDEKANLDIALVEVTVDESGALETPKKWNEGGWYRYGANPGEPGNLIINAHYDNNYGGPAAFWKLKNLKVDDKVNVFDTYDRKYTYKVIDSFLVDINDPNRLEVFKDDQNATMTLITCGGIWLPGESTYNKRLVVKAELVQSIGDQIADSVLEGMTDGVTDLFFGNR